MNKKEKDFLTKEKSQNKTTEKANTETNSKTDEKTNKKKNERTNERTEEEKLNNVNFKKIKVNVKKNTCFLIEGAVIAALYAAVTLALAPLSFGSVQLRISEGFCALALFSPAAIPGLTVGCIISNLFSPMGMADVIFGSLATFLSAALIYLLKNVKIKNYPFLFIVFPSVINGIIVGLELKFCFGTEKTAFWLLALYVAAGEFLSLISFGNLIYFSYKKFQTKLFKK